MANDQTRAFDRGSYSKMSDIEKMIGGDYAQLTNTNIRSFGWKGVTVTVKDRQTRRPKTILNDINGIVKAGELLALMGPSYAPPCLPVRTPTIHC